MLTVTSGRKSCRSHLCKEQLLIKDEMDITDNNAASLKKLELQEKAREREAEVKLKELELQLQKKS